MAHRPPVDFWDTHTTDPKTGTVLNADGSVYVSDYPTGSEWDDSQEDA